jgi:hypothetical protein
MSLEMGLINRIVADRIAEVGARFCRMVQEPAACEAFATSTQFRLVPGLAQFSW